jgi:hypothetical protein
MIRVPADLTVACSEMDVVESVTVTRGRPWDHHESYSVIGSRQTQKPPRLVHKLHILQLTEDDKQRLQLDTTHVPSPRVHYGSTAQFSLHVTSSIM